MYRWTCADNTCGTIVKNMTWSKHHHSSTLAKEPENVGLLFLLFHSKVNNNGWHGQG